MTEIELKLVPRDEALLDRLAAAERLGQFEVTARRREQQRNSFFDTRSQGFRRARVGFRRRVMPAQRMATWTLKAEGDLFRGVATRAEVEVAMDADTPPVLVLQALSARAEPALREQVADATADGQLPLAQPYLQMVTDRWVLDLRSADATLELALDRVSIPRTEYAELEIEVELKRGEQQALDQAREAIEALGDVRESSGSKLTRALDYIDRSASSSR